MTLTFSSTQSKINENHKLRKENYQANIGIADNCNDEVIVKLLQSHIDSNNVKINANNFILANYITIIN